MVHIKSSDHHLVNFFTCLWLITSIRFREPLPNKSHLLGVLVKEDMVKCGRQDGVEKM